MKILVTGGCGFIGSNFVHYILKKYKNYEIIILDKLTYAGNFDNLKDVPSGKYRFVKGDICDIHIVDKCVKKADVIVHFAAESHVDRSIDSSGVFVNTNVIGTHVLLEAAKRYNKRFHHISTDEVFGSLDLKSKTKFNELTPYDPRSPYSTSKAASDHLVRAYYHTYGLKVTLSNCSNNYGPYQFPEKLIPLFITNLMQGKKVPVYGDGKNVRDWLHVEDHCEAIDLILHKGKIGETYCIGGDCEKSNLEISKILLKEFKVGNEMIQYVEDRKGHDRRYAINASKIKRQLGWKPRHNFQSGIKDTIKWYKNNTEWWRPLKR